MKVSIYLDVFPWMRKSEDIFVALQPSSPKQKGCTRYCVDVSIPDPAKPDIVIEGKAIEVEE